MTRTSDDHIKLTGVVVVFDDGDGIIVFTLFAV